MNSPALSPAHAPTPQQPLTDTAPRLGVGLGWRSEIDTVVERQPGLDWVEVVAENLCADHLPASLAVLRARGVTVVPHGVGLGLGGAERPDAGRLAKLGELALALGSPLVTEHLAFVRAGGLEAGHLLPVPRTRASLRVIAENVRIAQEQLPVPLALENIAAQLAWPDDEFTEGEFLAELVARTGVRLLIDVANLHTNRVNLGLDPAAELDRLPLEALAYVHVAGGTLVDGVWHDTHAHPVTAPVLEVLAELCSRVAPPGVLLERDAAFPPPSELAGELDAIRGVLEGSTPRMASPARAATAKGYEPTTEPATEPATDADREHLALRQGELLAALVAAGPVPPGFDPAQVRAQRAGLASKRRDTAAKVAPELPRLLGSAYGPLFLDYARTHPQTGGYRADARAFAEWALTSGGPTAADHRRALEQWLHPAAERPPGPLTRLRRALRG
ncbi:DUF692 domain-containing protein [Streptomyces sp. NRRL WC-3742]|uniref:DUF692 domain-containing protein n=1 Tax=Streptomyces sp. NRRL WC-3742 TaxID=1463934 RepID=UPI00099BB2BF|nr:DUF692 domain-containing protein [Streptomyces sp. NRRL WC-3742]